MNLKNQPPIFVPPAHRAELEAYSKAALMDIAWLLSVIAGGSASDQETIEAFRRTAKTVASTRKAYRGKAVAKSSRPSVG